MSWLSQVIEKFHPSCKRARACVVRVTAYYEENEELMRQAEVCAAATCKCGKFATCNCAEAENGERHERRDEAVYHRA